MALRLALDDPYHAPEGYPIKADTTTGQYWTPGTWSYDRARAEIASSPFGRAGKLTMSAGVGLVSPPSDGDTLYRMADRALYEAKQSGRNRTCCHGAGVLRTAQRAS